MLPPLPTHTHTLQGAEVEEVSSEVVDLQQKLAILQAKRQEDKAKLKELEKYRIQVHQVRAFGHVHIVTVECD